MTRHLHSELIARFGSTRIESSAKFSISALVAQRLVDSHLSLSFSRYPSAPGACTFLYLCLLELAQFGFDYACAEPAVPLYTRKVHWTDADHLKSLDHSLLLLLLPRTRHPHLSCHGGRNRKNNSRPLPYFQGTEICKSKLIARTKAYVRLGGVLSATAAKPCRMVSRSGLHKLHGIALLLVLFAWAWVWCLDILYCAWRGGSETATASNVVTP